MERKKKKCKDCGKPSYIKGHGRCSSCYSIWYAKENPDKLLKRTGFKKKVTLKSGKKITRKRKAPKKTKKQKLIAKLDKTFSLLTRLTYANDQGVCNCFTCNKPLSWKRGAVSGLESAQAAHFISRRFMSTRWLEDNVYPGCHECNVTKDGNIKVYEQKLKDKFGEYFPSKLWTIALTHHKYTEQELIVLLRKIEAEYKALKKEKGL